MKNLYLILLSLFFLFSCGKKPVYKSSSQFYKENQIKARDHFATGMFYQLDNMHEKALLEYYQALLYDSSSAAIYNQIAENHMALGRYESALRYLQKSISLDSQLAETYRLISDCYYRLKDDDKTIEYLEIVIQMDPFDENSRSLLLLLYRKNGNHLALAKQYEELINIYGHDEKWVRKAATIYLQNRQLDDALALFQSYIKSDSTNAGMWFSLGTTYELKKLIEDAIYAYKNALKFSHEFNEASERIYRLYRQQSQWDKIISLFKPLYNENPDFLIHRMALAEAYLFSNEYKKSKELLLPLLEKNEVMSQTYELLGRIELENNNYPKAAEHFQKIIDKDLKNRVGWIMLGIVYTQMDSLNKAENHYRKALQYLPDDPHVLAFHGISLSRLGKDEEALSPLQKAIEIDPKNLNALNNFGISLNRLQRNEEAIEPLESVLKIEPDNLTALTTLGMIYDDLKLYVKCDTLYERALQTYPDNDLLMNNYSYSLSVRGENLEYALQLAQKSVEAQPQNGAYLDTIGWIYYKLGRFELALKYIKESIENREPSPVVREHLGDVYLKLGDIKQAKIHWNEALEMDKSNEELRHKIENN